MEANGVASVEHPGGRLGLISGHIGNLALYFPGFFRNDSAVDNASNNTHSGSQLPKLIFICSTLLAKYRIHSDDVFPS
jgi:hypothetical protein